MDKILLLVFFILAVCAFVAWVEIRRKKNESPTERERREENERMEKRRSILFPSASFWTGPGVVLILIGIIIVGFGIYLMLSAVTGEDSQYAGIIGALFGPTIIIIGLLVSLFGILCIIAGINRRAENRLKAIQLLSYEQRILLGRIAGDPPEQTTEDEATEELLFGISSEPVTLPDSKGTSNHNLNT